MALVLQDDFNFKSNADAFEKASFYFGRIEKLANTAIEINQLRYGDFENPFYREDCVFYQLEAIRDLAHQFDDLFNGVVRDLGIKSDKRLAALEGKTKTDNTLKNQATSMTDDEAKLLADFRAADKVSQNFSLVQSHFLAEKPCNETMRNCLSMLAFLCVNTTEDSPKSCGELLPEESGKGVLSAGKGKDAATPPGAVE